MKNKKFYEVFGIRGGMQNLESMHDVAREKFLEIDTKLPEIFLIISSILLAYLGTNPKNNFAFFSAIACFMFMILLSLLTFRNQRKLHLHAIEKTTESLKKFREIHKKYKGQDIKKGSSDHEAYQKELLEATKEGLTDKKMKISRKKVELLLDANFFFFVTGLLFTIFSWEIVSTSLIISILRVIYVILYIFAIFISLRTLIGYFSKK